MSIVQWNCRGVRPNFEEIKSLLIDNKPVAVCLQETFLKDTDTINFKGIVLLQCLPEMAELLEEPLSW